MEAESRLNSISLHRYLQLRQCNNNNTTNSSKAGRYPGLIRIRLERLFDSVSPSEWRNNVFLGFLADGQLLCSYRFLACDYGDAASQDGDDSRGGGDLFVNSYQLLLWQVDVRASQPRATLAVAYDISWLARFEHQPICVTECRGVACVSTPQLPHRRLLIGLPSLTSGCANCSVDLAAGSTVSCSRHVWRCQLEEPASTGCDSELHQRFSPSTISSDPIIDSDLSNKNSSRKCLNPPTASIGALGPSRVLFKDDSQLLVFCDSLKSISGGSIRLVRVGPIFANNFRRKFPGDRLCKLRLCPCGLAYNFLPESTLAFYECFADVQESKDTDDSSSDSSASVDEADDGDVDEEAEESEKERELKYRLSLSAGRLARPTPSTPCDLCLFLKYTQYYPTSSVLNFNQFSPIRLYQAQRLSLNRRGIHSHSLESEPYPSPCCCDLIGCRQGPIAVEEALGLKSNASCISNDNNNRHRDLLSQQSELSVCSPCNYLYTDNRYLSYTYRLFSAHSGEPDELPVYDYSDLTGSAHCSALLYCMRGNSSALEYAGPLNWTFDTHQSTADQSASLWHFEELSLSVPAFLRSHNNRLLNRQKFVRFIFIDECRLGDNDLIIVIETLSSNTTTAAAYTTSASDSDSSTSSTCSPTASKRRKVFHCRQNQTTTTTKSSRRWLELSLNLTNGILRYNRCITSLNQVLPSLNARQSNWSIDNFAMSTHARSATRLVSEGGEIVLEL
ncbi:hypothetical protein BOX15_Mlig013487g1 [Macrostomum lignano]|uniref:DCAF15_WD40 domain-containing protein n=2 Tax=Macrostomum lignano TaxID=282301 RepID=A0A1I8G8M2_9PLAT|nr:hypothetical protein BOX15_Mlig013487g1 [Macrostomum lignano]